MEKKEPLVSIVVPCYNHGNFIHETIKSIIDQDYKNIELIVIDDGSKDNSVSKVKELLNLCEERFVRFEFRNRDNKGLCATLNEGLEWSNGIYFSAIASDDVLKVNKVSTQVEYLEKNIDTIGVFGAIEILKEDGTKIIKYKKFNKYKFTDILLHRHNLPAPTQLLRADKIKAVGGYDEKIVIEDFYMWLKLTEGGGTLDYLEPVFAIYRRHGGNTSSDIEKMHAGRLQVLNKYVGKKYYSLAISNCFLVSALEIMESNRKLSLKYFLTGFFYSFRFLFQIRVMKYIYMMVFKK